MLVIKPVDTRNKNATNLLRLLLKQDNISRVDENIKEISNLLQTNDRVVSSIVKQIATRIGAAVINIIHIIGPQTVFIGGKMAVLGDALIQPIKEIVSQYLFGDQAVEVRLSEISEDAVAIGNAIYATTKYLEERSIGHIPIRGG